MRIFPLRASSTPSLHHTPGRRASRLDRDAIDDFVHIAHTAPMAAITKLNRNHALATAVSSWGETAVQAASHLGHRKLIARLAQCGAKLDVFAAAAMADLNMVSSMLASGPKDLCGVHDLPLLHFAVMSREAAMVEALTAAGSPLCPPAASLSPLHSAVGIGSTRMVRALVSAGVEVAFTDAFGQTALDWAYDLGGADQEMLELLGASSVRAAHRSA
jgi:hypothetical protein